MTDGLTPAQRPRHEYAVHTQELPIFKSAYMGGRNTVIAQAEAGVDIHVQGPWNGYSPLHDALWQGHADVAEALIMAGPT